MIRKSKKKQKNKIKKLFNNYVEKNEKDNEEEKNN